MIKKKNQIKNETTITTVVRKHHVSNSDMALVQRLHLWALAKTRTSW